MAADTHTHTHSQFTHTCQKRHTTDTHWAWSQLWTWCSTSCFPWLAFGSGGVVDLVSVFRRPNETSMCRPQRLLSSIRPQGTSVYSTSCVEHFCTNHTPTMSSSLVVRICPETEAEHIEIKRVRSPSSGFSAVIFNHDSNIY